ncbi:transmembrane protein 130 [Protopterus annectens]|uniref:transmembrane protein 130 n=1 Tax=Protopterus annectens TaxID=7888 RepID=UPI001CFAF809|nr:transmembrane protein 130 [Protopterus annectens]
MTSALFVALLAFVSSLAFKAADGAVRYNLEVDNDAPITTGALGAVKARLVINNGTGTFTANPNLYQFHWTYSILNLVEKSEDEFHSWISVQSDIPGNYTVTVSVHHTDCWRCPSIAQNATVLQFTESVVGNILIAQADGNATFVNDSTNLATETVTKMSFVLHDPSSYLSTALFSYKWEFGDGNTFLTDVPEAEHIYTTAGSYTLKLRVGARLRGSQNMKIGYFSSYLQLFDPVKSIKVKGPTSTIVEQNLSLSIHVNGSPPLSLCWHMSSECVALSNQCSSLVNISTPHYSLDYQFNATGRKCLSLSVWNRVSMLQAYHAITVTHNSVLPLLFILPCAILLVIVIGFIASTMLRGTRPPKDMVEVADFDFSPMADKPTLLLDSDVNTVNTCCLHCFRQKDGLEEEQPLLWPRTRAVRQYTV